MKQKENQKGISKDNKSRRTALNALVWSYKIEIRIDVLI